MMNLDLLKRSVVTEKSVVLSGDNKYVFHVSNDANKIEVARTIEKLYGVKPLAVHITTLPEKHSGRGRLKRKFTKRAIVTLKKGDKLDPSKVK
jgi:large subunit ribosomal protein L23